MKSQDNSRHNSKDSSDLRSHPRRQILSGKLPGRVYAAERAIVLHAKSFDISKKGMGIVIDAALAPGDFVWVITDDIGMKFEVRHCARKKGVEGYYCGLTATTSTDEVEAMFSKAGIY